MNFRHSPFLGLSSLLLVACGAPSESSSQTSATALDTSPMTRDALAKAVESENAWIQGSTDCTLTVDRTGSDVVITLVAYSETATLTVPADAAITSFVSDDHRYSEYNVAGIGQVRVLFSLDMYREITVTPATQKPVVCGLYWG
jgi:hypothetical protein